MFSSSIAHNLSPSSSIAESDPEIDSISPSSSMAGFYSEIGSKTHDESIVLIKSVEEVRLYLDIWMKDLVKNNISIITKLGKKGPIKTIIMP